ncbi:MAG TPA: hypothetical protein VLQ80_29210 [Candidatus Saccharimonadia bacterium]|nr:hypothetical protein [Candidatus Saccharimonadia bacterium]
MPAVIETHELEIEHVETSDLSLERSQPRRAPPGFWRSLVHKITTHLSPTPREQHAPLCSAPRPFEAPMDQLVREYPSLAVYALALI